MKVAGVVLLAALVIYKDLNGKPFHTGWWGILGLIGWTYAVCAGIYLFTRESLRKNAIAWFAVIALAVISHSGLIPEEYGSRILLLPFIPSDWTLHAFGMSGLLTSAFSASACSSLHWFRIHTGLSPRYRLPRPGCFIALPLSSRYSASSIG